MAPLASLSCLRGRGDRLRWERGAPCSEQGTVQRQRLRPSVAFGATFPRKRGKDATALSAKDYSHPASTPRPPSANTPPAICASVRPYLPVTAATPTEAAIPEMCSSAVAATKPSA